ncbi:hypothetical protein Aasi_0727 [Candidatus Amoebophilus asiaticus 5a2]|uniref:Smr domain-containing protein n=1 Tax=Amoebophilus asiaticus (strain 5a2) TaxID=452471 RepID=B3ESA9_AMOA5|nr:Smr/MutS family protein [Candidatus Amoebophilus asiaticus]ACE06111.1 hypothetical protein Aasi_0727 [Candidatus Amoebophilus asiaticus 5a2]
MHLNYNIRHKLIAYTLLLSLFLQSCGNSSNLLTPRIKESIENIPGETKQIATNPLVGQEFTAKGGYLITFHVQGRELQADVRVDETQKKPNCRNLPVAIEKDIDLASWVKLAPKIQKRCVHVSLPRKGQPGSVYIFKEGLPGGMKGYGGGSHRGQKGNNRNKAKGNRKEKVGKVSTVSSSYTNVSTSSNRQEEDTNSNKTGSLTASPNDNKKRSKGKEKLKDDKAWLDEDEVDENKHISYEDEVEILKQGITRPNVPFIRYNIEAQGADDKILSHDFHGCRVPEFKAGVRKLLKQAQEENANRVTLITGKGNHSPNGPVLLKVLPNLLKKEFSEVIHEPKRDLGAYEVVLKKKERPSLYEEKLKKLKEISSFLYNSKLKTKLVEDAKRGLNEAQYELGAMLLEGIVFEKNEQEGFEWISKAAETDATAQVLLGYCYEVGKGVPQNYKLSKYWYKKALAQDSPDAAFALGKYYWMGISVIRNDKKGLQLLEKAANQGHAWAAYNYGDILFQHSTKVPVDRSQAPKYIEQAARNGVLPAQTLLAKLYFFGWEVDIDDRKALFYFLQAAEAGDVIAQYYCGRCYSEGRGTAIDSVQALKWYEASATQGDLDAKLSVAGLLMRGEKTQKKDFFRALHMLEELAKVNHGNSVYLLGIVYFYGQGPIQPNQEKAIPLFLHAAENGTLEAQLLIAKLFTCNKIKTISCDQILTWLREAAKLEDPEALYYLGLILDQKEENKHQTEILECLTKASNQGHRLAKLMLAMKLMEEEIEHEQVLLVLQLLREAAKEHPLALDILGGIYMDGKIAPLNEKLAFAYFEKGAEFGHRSAITNLAFCYLFGKGIKQNDRLAAENFLKSAKLGDPFAQIQIAKCLLKGRGIEANHLEAVSFLKEATDQGLTEAEFLLGWIYATSSNGILAKPAQGFNLLKKAAASGHKEAAHLLGQLCLDGTPSRVEEGISWLKKAALLGDLRSQFLLGTLYIKPDWVKSNRDKAIKWFKMAAAQGHPTISFFLGHLLCSQSRYDEAKEYLEKFIANESEEKNIMEMKQRSYKILAQIYTTEGNPSQAIKYYKLCPEEPEVMYQLGYLYDVNENLDLDKSLVISCLMKSAQQNHLEAQYCLGCVFGKLAKSNPAYGKGAFQWFSIAADNGHLRATYELGCIYLKGEFDQKVELQKAWKLLLLPAKQGDANAQFLLGCMCTFWPGLKPKYAEGVRWFTKAAEQGHLGACFSLGYAYQLGQGVELNWLKAISWYLRSAEKGHIESQYNLGTILLSMKKQEEAIYWLKKAAAQGAQEAQNVLSKIFVEEEEIDELTTLVQQEQQDEEQFVEAQGTEQASTTESDIEDLGNAENELESIYQDEYEAPVRPWTCSLQ